MFEIFPVAFLVSHEVCLDFQMIRSGRFRLVQQSAQLLRDWKLADRLGSAAAATSLDTPQWRLMYCKKIIHWKYFLLTIIVSIGL